jgi:hypothetical protein
MKLGIKNLFELTNEKRISAFAKNPLKGGIPANEKNTTTKENAQVLLIFDIFEILDKKIDLIFSL